MQRSLGDGKHVVWEGHSGKTESVLQDETEQVVKHIQTFLQEVFLDG